MDAVQEVKSRLNIEDVIGEYVRLKRMGKNYKGLSPFSNEKTPSFVVSPEKQIWHDFSSGRGGDVLSFVQEVEGLDFRGALELLARKAGVDLEQYQTKNSGRRGPDKERLLAALDEAAKFYQVQLGANKTALDYVAKQRAFTRQTILDFRLGYSPDTGNALLTYLKKKHFTDAEIQAAGLSATRGSRTSDMFRGRVMVPLCDQFGKVIGFTARLLHDTPGAPKYINTPATVLYDKSRHVYGLHQAKRAIQTQKFSVLVEGNLDVISSHQAGIANVVATAGTALTDMQLKILGRFSPDVRLAFDEDKAGIAATERAIPIAAKTGVQLSVVTIPSGKDPDELVRQDPEIWKQVIAEHVYAVDWLIESYKKQVDVESAVGKRQLSDAVLPVIRGLQDDIEKDHYVHQLAQLLGITPPAVRAKLDGTDQADRVRLKNVKKPIEPTPINNQIAVKLSDRLLGLALMLPSCRAYLEDLTSDMFPGPERVTLYEFLRAHPDFDGSVASQEGLHKIQDYVKIVSLQFEELYVNLDTLELQYEAARLKTQLVEIFVKDQKQYIAKQLQTVSREEAQTLLERARDLDLLLKRTKE